MARVELGKQEFRQHLQGLNPEELAEHLATFQARLLTLLIEGGFGATLSLGAWMAANRSTEEWQLAAEALVGAMGMIILTRSFFIIPQAFDHASFTIDEARGRGYTLLNHIPFKYFQAP